VSGYNVYRGTQQGPYSKLNSQSRSALLRTARGIRKTYF
jgi:hypothetical protein